MPVCSPAPGALEPLAGEIRASRTRASTHAPACEITVPEDFLGRVLQAFELGELVARLARTPEVRTLAEGLCPPETERSWQMLYHDEGVDVWLIVWRRQADTGWHDHDTSAGAFHVIEGEVSEARPNLFGGGTPRTVTI